ncbi:MAG: helix-turn-helix domain-containing protein, partial [Phycisphaeraceae bacterium]
LDESQQEVCVPDSEAATMTVEEAGKLLGISRHSAYRAAATGHLPTIRLGRRILVPTARLHRMLGIVASHDSTRNGSHHEEDVEVAVHGESAPASG